MDSWSLPSWLSLRQRAFPGAVPEPSTLVLILVAGALWTFQRLRSKFSSRIS